MIFATPSSVQLMLFDEPQVAKRGRFTVKNTPDALQTILEQVSGELKQNRDRKSADRLVAILERLTVVQLHELKRQHGMKASGRNKAELVQKLASRLDRGRRADFSMSPVVEMSEKQKEQAIVRDLRAGVDGAFDRLYERYSMRLHSRLRTKVSDRDADDIVQETFLRVSMNIDRLSEEKSLPGYLWTIAFRIVIDMDRSAARRGKCCTRSMEISGEVATSERDECKPAEQAEQYAMVMTILDEQPELTKQIVRMYFFDQMTYVEIAQQLGIGATTAKDRVKKAIGAVQQRAMVSCCE